VSRLVVRGGVFHRGPFRGALGDDAPSAPTSIDSPAVVKDLYSHFELGQQIDARTALILKKIDEQDRARKWTLIIGGASALFAAVKLGFVAFPHLRRGGGG
jgi:hypothetical protein